MTDRDSALSFVGQINKAYDDAEKAGASALGHALECGKLLIRAKENVEAEKGKGKWKGWREKHLPKVSEETEKVYRRLAEAVAKKEDIFAKCKSIRDAIKHLSEFELDENGNLKPKPPRTRTSKPGTGSSATGLALPGADRPSTDPAVVLQAIEASDIIDNIKDDDDKMEEVAQRSIVKLAPDKVCDALTKAWTSDQLKDLNRRLTLYLSKSPTDPAAPSMRRPLGSMEMPGIPPRQN